MTLPASIIIVRLRSLTDIYMACARWQPRNVDRGDAGEAYVLLNTIGGQIDHQNTGRLATDMASPGDK